MKGNLIKMKIHEIQNVRLASYVGAKIEVDEVKIYEGIGVSLYRNGKQISFIEMNVIDVMKMEENFTSHQYFIKPDAMSHGIYLFREIPTLNVRENHRVVKKGDDCRHLFVFYSHIKELKEKYTDIELAHLKDEFLWTIIEIHDNVIAKIERNDVMEMILLKELISLEEIEKIIITER